MEAANNLGYYFLVGIWVETLLYGANFIIFLGTIHTLANRETGRAKVPYMISVACILFALSTIYVSLTFRQLLEAFIWGSHIKPDYFFATRGDRLALAKLMTYSVLVSAQDLILIWRLWVVWDNNWLLTAPFLLLEAMRLTASTLVVYYGSGTASSIFDVLVHNWALVNFTLELFINIVVTAMIAGRLWKAGASTSVESKVKYMSVIFTIVESGLLFTSATIVVAILYLSNNTAVIPAIDAIVQLASITPLMIVLRLGLGITHGPVSFGSRSQDHTVSVSVNRRTINYGITSPRTAHVTLSQDVESAYYPKSSSSKSPQYAMSDLDRDRW